MDDNGVTPSPIPEPSIESQAPPAQHKNEASEEVNRNNKRSSSHVSGATPERPAKQIRTENGSRPDIHDAPKSKINASQQSRAQGSSGSPAKLGRSHATPTFVTPVKESLAGNKQRKAAKSPASTGTVIMETYSVTAGVSNWKNDTAFSMRFDKVEKTLTPYYDEDSMEDVYLLSTHPELEIQPNGISGLSIVKGEKDGDTVQLQRGRRHGTVSRASTLLTFSFMKSKSAARFAALILKHNPELEMSSFDK